MSLRQPLIHRRREQKPGIAIDRPEVAHRVFVCSPKGKRDYLRSIIIKSDRLLGRVYIAPENTWGDLAHGPHLDVFSLGAIAYHVFSGQPPAASSLDLHDKLRAGPGLRISDVMDGAGKSLQDLVQFSTISDVSARFSSVDDFLRALEEVEDELTAPDPEKTVDPSNATAGERIQGGFTVGRRLGKGSSSDVLLVKSDGTDEELVLKVASETAHNDRLVAEGEVLAKLRHANVVEYRKTLSIAGRTALLMSKAGDRTLGATFAR